jgi:hypothetical protein
LNKKWRLRFQLEEPSLRKILKTEESQQNHLNPPNLKQEKASQRPKELKVKQQVEKYQDQSL